METVTSRDGTRIAYVRRGSGPALVMVHGTTADHTRWDSVTPWLEDEFTVVAMDRRGRGESGDADTYEVVREGEDVAAVVEAMDGPVYLLGHSYGGVVALEAALLTDRIDKLVLYEPVVPNPPHRIYQPEVVAKTEVLLDEARNEDAMEVFVREGLGMPDLDWEAYRTSPVFPRRVAMAHTLYREMDIDRIYSFRPERFAGYRVPTLLMVGEQSPPLFRHAADAVRSALPELTYVELEGQQHIAMDTAPGLFASTVKGFLLG
jgi:pimeloyl-ACP methyl ester carboxylesterase